MAKKNSLNELAKVDLAMLAKEAAVAQCGDLLRESFGNAWALYQSKIQEYARDNPGTTELKVKFPLSVKIVLAPHGPEHSVTSRVEFSRGKYTMESETAMVGNQLELPGIGDGSDGGDTGEE